MSRERSTDLGSWAEDTAIDIECHVDPHVSLMLH